MPSNSEPVPNPLETDFWDSAYIAMQIFTCVAPHQPKKFILLLPVVISVMYGSSWSCGSLRFQFRSVVQLRNQFRALASSGNYRYNTVPLPVFHTGRSYALNECMQCCGAGLFLGRLRLLVITGVKTIFQQNCRN